MTTQRIPLVGVPNTRNIDPINSFTKDQIFKSVVFDILQNPQTGNKTIYCNRRPGVKGALASGANSMLEIEDGFGFKTLPIYLSAYYNGSSTTTVSDLGTNYGTIAGNAKISITKAFIGEETYLISSSGDAMYYMGETGYGGAVTYTGTSHSNTTIDGIASTAGLVVGQLLTPTGPSTIGIVAGTRVASVGANSIVTTIAVTNSVTDGFTRERMSKVIDADAPVPIGPMVEMSGFIFVAQNNSQKIWNSDLNSIASWTATSFLSANLTAGRLNGVSRLKNNIIGHVVDSLQFFYNAGNAAGSPLSSMPDSAKRFGSSTTTSQFPGQLFRPFSVVDDIVAVIYDGVYLLTPSGVQPISDAIVQKIVMNANKNNIIIRAFRFSGNYYIYLADSGNGWQFLYDVKAGLWVQAGFPNPILISKVWGNVVYTSADGGIYNYPFSLISSAQTPVYQDNGSAYSMVIQTSTIDHGTLNRKFVSELGLVCDIETSGTVLLEKSDDDYVSWQTLGTFDLTIARPRVSSGGSYTGGRAYRLTHSTNAPFRAQALDITFKIGNS